jgi:homogentisate 1,2-dioxygenase
VEELEVIHIGQQAARLTEPFTMVDLASIDDLVLSIFLCQGTLPHHRHVDQDELFLVHNGTISLESDWGNVILRAGELAVAPKGVGHRSSALVRSQVLLLQPRLMVNRRNGHRRLFAPKESGRLEKVNLPAVGRQIGALFQPVIIAHLDTYAVHLNRCLGDGPFWESTRQDRLVLCQEGQLTLYLGMGEPGPGRAVEEFDLKPGDLFVVPKGMSWQISSSTGALVLGVQRHRQPSSSLAG